eukprot:6015968-Ditylum_brightwellii.AAC.1
MVKTESNDCDVNKNGEHNLLSSSALQMMSSKVQRSNGCDVNNDRECNLLGSSALQTMCSK